MSLSGQFSGHKDAAFSLVSSPELLMWYSREMFDCTHAINRLYALTKQNEIGARLARTVNSVGL